MHSQNTLQTKRKTIAVYLQNVEKTPLKKVRKRMSSSDDFLIIPPSEDDWDSVRASIRAYVLSKKGEVKTDFRRKVHEKTEKENEFMIPVSLNAGNKIPSTANKRIGSCCKCCKNTNLSPVLKPILKPPLKYNFQNENVRKPHQLAFTSVSYDCEKDKIKRKNKNKNIFDPDTEDSEISIYEENVILEPMLNNKRSITSLINAQYESNEELSI